MNVTIFLIETETEIVLLLKLFQIYSLKGLRNK